jgi:hypothetical protein
MKLNKIISLKNPDKIHNEYYTPGRENLDFPKSFIAVISGRPNCGKTNTIYNLIVKFQSSKKKFKEIHIVHGSEYSNEYDIIDPTSIRPDIPSYLEFENVDEHKLIIIDDYDWTAIPSDTLKKVSELVRFGSSHHCISLIFVNQSFFRLPKIIKDMANIFIIYKPIDLDELNTLGRRVGFKRGELKDLFKKKLPHWRDSLLINLIPSNPYSKFYKNLYEPIEIEELD